MCPAIQRRVKYLTCYSFEISCSPNNFLTEVIVQIEQGSGKAEYTSRETLTNDLAGILDDKDVG